jgi:protein-S-isoprenylcysteine O-methyltransferase Ste14
MLGRFFTRSVMIREDHRVITGGPYRLLRHPAYSGTLLTGLGFGVMLGSWLSIAIMFIGVLVALLPRILHEERVLEASLGDPYRDFARGRKRLVPFVW